MAIGKLLPVDFDTLWIHPLTSRSEGSQKETVRIPKEDIQSQRKEEAT
jgi:hypothetical protein